MRKNQDDTWRPIGSITQQILAQLEEKQRKRFERDCEGEGVKAKQEQPA